MQTVFHSNLNTPPPRDVFKLPSKPVYVSRVLQSCIICMMEVFLDELWLTEISLLMEVLPWNSLKSKQISHFGKKNHSTVHFKRARAKKQTAFPGVFFSTWFGCFLFCFVFLLSDLVFLCSVTIWKVFFARSGVVKKQPILKYFRKKKLHVKVVKKSAEHNWKTTKIEVISHGFKFLINNI